MKRNNNFFRLLPERKKFQQKYSKYLNTQARLYLRPFAVAAIGVWLVFAFYMDKVLHPEYPELFYYRIGLSLTGIVVLIISFIKKLNQKSLIWFLLLTAYLLFSSSFFTGRLANDPNYVSGLQIIILVIVLGPFTLRSIYILYAISVGVFISGIYIYKPNLSSYSNHYSMNNLILAYAIGILAAFVVDRLRFSNYYDSIQLKEANEKIWSEIELAKKIQTILLPQKPHIHDFEIAAHMAPALEVGGDYYDIINVDGCDWLVIGDVSGHGVPAGLIMMMVQTSIQTVVRSNLEIRPSELLAMVNKSVTTNIKQLGENKYMTITVLAYHKNGKFCFSGLHQNIIIYRQKKKSIEIIETRGFWLGIEYDIRDMLIDDNLEMEIGDVMIVFTDGITESLYRKSSCLEINYTIDMYGEEQLIDVFNKLCLHNYSPKGIITGLIDSLQEYDIIDDMTMVVLKRVK